MKNSRKAIIYALIAVAMWSTVATAFKLSLQQMSLLQLLTGASFFSLIIVGVCLYQRDYTNDPPVIPAQAGIYNGQTTCHSRGGGNLYSTTAPYLRWIPVSTGMTEVAQTQGALAGFNSACTRE